MSKLFVVEGSQTKVLDQKAFDNEKLLQDVVEKFPEVIALEDLGVQEPFIVIGREVAAGTPVTLPGIGKIAPRSRPERQVRNPATGEMMTKPADKAVKFTAAKALKDLVQQ